MTQKQWEAIIKSREDKLLSDFSNEIEKRDKLITECADALEKWSDWNTFNPGEINRLIQRAREATK
jgi:hypothetical protein